MALIPPSTVNSAQEVGVEPIYIFDGVVAFNIGLRTICPVAIDATYPVWVFHTKLLSCNARADCPTAKLYAPHAILLHHPGMTLYDPDAVLLRPPAMTLYDQLAILVDHPPTTENDPSTLLYQPPPIDDRFHKTIREN